MSDKKPGVVSDIVPLVSKITEHKLNGINFLDWNNTIELYLLSISMDGHLTDDPPMDASKLSWMREDARLYIQIRNSIDSEVVGLVTHCKTVKQLMNYLQFLYSGKGNFSRIYDVCKDFYRADKEDKSLTSYFMDFKKTYEELNMLLPFSCDVEEQRNQREKMAVMSFLAGLPSEFETAKSQILSGSEISSLEDAFRRVLRTENTLPVLSTQPNSVLLSRTTTADSGRQHYKSNGNSKSMGSGPNHSDKNTSNHGQEQGEIVCHYCHKPGHIKRDCRKLQYKKAHSAHIASSCATSDKHVTISADEYARLTQFQETVKQPSGHVTAPVETGKPNACLVSSSPKWVIDSGATDHMTGNPSLLSNFQPHKSITPVTLADGSTSSVIGSGTTKPTSSLHLSSVLSLPQLSFNLISVSKLTRALNCCVSLLLEPKYQL